MQIVCSTESDASFYIIRLITNELFARMNVFAWKYSHELIFDECKFDITCVIKINTDDCISGDMRRSVDSDTLKDVADRMKSP